VLYTPDIIAKVYAEVVKSNSIFSLDDRVGLVLDSVALAKAGFSSTSSAFRLINSLKGEKECLSFDSDRAWSFVAEDRPQQTLFGIVFATASPK
jgi:aminopeptidase 2